eukprot:TRINITY_DN6596_c0_g1_i3.p1 TRINITY_DN6596_c0_g1~~TRINITY_DN6596_c0_g1_i3.p1  ORF type:complete len:437 (-),score=96.75 TRINITY_DN6596_c0_g1_i3:50-1360(-)
MAGYSGLGCSAGGVNIIEKCGVNLAREVEYIAAREVEKATHERKVHVLVHSCNTDGKWGAFFVKDITKYLGKQPELEYRSLYLAKWLEFLETTLLEYRDADATLVAGKEMTATESTKAAWLKFLQGQEESKQNLPEMVAHRLTSQATKAESKRSEDAAKADYFSDVRGRFQHFLAASENPSKGILFEELKSYMEVPTFQHYNVYEDGLPLLIDLWGQGTMVQVNPGTTAGEHMRVFNMIGQNGTAESAEKAEGKKAFSLKTKSGEPVKGPNGQLISYPKMRENYVREDRLVAGLQSLVDACRKQGLNENSVVVHMNSLGCGGGGSKKSMVLPHIERELKSFEVNVWDINGTLEISDHLGLEEKDGQIVQGICTLPPEQLDLFTRKWQLLITHARNYEMKDNGCSWQELLSKKDTHAIDIEAEFNRAAEGSEVTPPC